MYLGLAVVTIAVGLILAKSTIFVGLVGSQLPPPAITGTVHHRFGLSVKKKSSAVFITVLTWPLFWQIRLSIAILPFIELPVHSSAVVNPALMSGAPEEQSKYVVQHASSFPS